MSLIQKKYKRLLGELSYLNSEMNHINDMLQDAHVEFEIFYKQYCRDYNVPLEDLQKNNSSKIQNLFPDKKPKIDESGLVKHESSGIKNEKIDKTLQKMYRKAAIITHPDKFTNRDDAEALEAAETFKKLTSAFNGKEWADFLDICEKLNILPSTYKKIIDIIKKEIGKTKLKIDKSKQTYSWKLLECDDDKICKMTVVKGFLKHVFGYEKEAVLLINEEGAH